MLRQKDGEQVQSGLHSTFKKKKATGLEIQHVSQAENGKDVKLWFCGPVLPHNQVASSNLGLLQASLSLKCE